MNNFLRLMVYKKLKMDQYKNIIELIESDALKEGYIQFFQIVQKTFLTLCIFWKFGSLIFCFFKG